MLFSGAKIIAAMLFSALVPIVGAASQTSDVIEATEAPEPISQSNFWLDFEPSYVEQVCPFAGEGAYDTAAVTCGYVLVPEDRRSESSRLIKIQLMKVSSTAEENPIGTLVSLSGGPGLNAVTIENANRFAGPDGAKLRSAVDLVFFDQRGVGYSEPEFCRAIPDAHQYGVRRSPEGEGLFWANMRQCLDEARAQGVAIEAYSSWHNAHDVRDIRRALGLEAWSIFGVSYGSELGQAVLQIDGEATRAAILDSIVPIIPNPSGGWSDYAAAFEAAIRGMETACEEDPQCARANPDLAARLFSAVKSYEADPIVFEGLNPNTYAGGRAVFDDQVAAMFVLILLYDVSLMDDIPAVVHVFEERDVDAIRAYFEAGAFPIGHAFGTGMGAITNCRGASIASPTQSAAYAAERPDLHRWVDILDWSDDCDAIYPYSPDASVNAFQTSVPTLIAAGANDPVTPSEFAKAILPSFEKATYVEFPYTGHVALASYLDGCGGEIAAQFLRAPGAEIDISCISETPRPAFLASFRKTKSAYGFLNGLQNGAPPTGLVIILLGLLIVIVAYPFGLTSRLIDSTSASRVVKGANLGRSLTWSSAVLSVVSIGLAMSTLVSWASQHPLAVPIGVPHSISVAGWVGLISVLLAIAGAFQTLRTAGVAASRATQTGSVCTALLAIASFFFLFSIGAGPL